MEAEAKHHRHPFARVGFSVMQQGHRLEPGDVIAETDVYASTNGEWEPATCPGVALQGTPGNTGGYWVRPTEKNEDVAE